MIEPNGQRYMVDSTGTYTFHLCALETGLDVSGIAFSPYESGGVVRKLITSISGLDHLEGKTVVALADGNLETGKVVVGGEIVLGVPSAKVQIGLPYECDLETMDFIPGNIFQTTSDKHRRIVSTMLLLDSTRSLKVGPDADSLNEVIFRTDELYGEPTRVYSGEQDVTLYPNDWKSSRVFMRVSDPLPASVLSIVPRMDVGGE
jgi:hypothetical protein